MAAAAPERRERILAVCAAEPGRRPESLSSWMKDLRSAVASTTFTGTSPGESVRDAFPGAVPPPPLVPPGAVVPQPEGPPGFPPPITASHDPGVPLPTTVAPGPPTAAYTAEPFPGPVSAPVSAPVPAAAPPPEKRGRLLRIALPTVAVVVLASLGAWGLQALNDDGDKAKAGAGSTKSSASHTPSATEEKTPGAETPVGEPGSGDTASPEATDPGSVEDASQTSLTTMSTVADPQLFTVGSAKVNTRVYNDAFVATPECGTGPYMEFDLNRAWKTFDVTAGIDDGSNYESGRLTIKVDEKTVWVGTVELGKPEKLSLKVEDGLRLRISIDETCYGAVFALGSPVLKR